MNRKFDAQFSEAQLQQIRMVFNEGINELVLPRFDEMEERFTGIDKRFTGIDKRLDNNDARLAMIETDVKYLRAGHDRLFKQVQRMDDQLAELITEVKAIRKQLARFITREEFNDLNERLARVEKQLGFV